jgi:predicted transcriptional regulator of viral defense system
VAPTLASLNLRVLRPMDADEIFTQPALQFRRLEEKGVLLKVAHGYYALIPEFARGGEWRPEIESLALGLGQADYGNRAVALMHLSAARIHGAIPRALAVAVLAVPKQRPLLETTCGRIIFVKRDVEKLKRMRVETELASGWSTNLEQTVLDLARRPDLVVGLSRVTREAACALFPRCDVEKLKVIVQGQRMASALARLQTWVEDA